MYKQVEATVEKHGFRVELQPDDSYRVSGLTPDPLPVFRSQARELLKWMDSQGAKEFRRELIDKR